jgi:hypothetical protein
VAPQHKPWEIAMAAQNEIFNFASSRFGMGYMAGWLGDRLAQYGIGAMNPSEVALRSFVDDCLECEPLYVTSEMQHLVYSAMETFDRTEQVHEDDFFLKSGFAYLDEQFVSLDVNRKRLGWRAISWVYDEMWTSGSESFLAQKEEIDTLLLSGKKITPGEFPDLVYEPVVRITLWSHIDDEDDFPYPPEDLETARRNGQYWGIAHATAIPIKEISAMSTINEGDVTAAWLTFLRVMNRLMAEKITLRTPQKPRRALRRESVRVGLDKSNVIVVELRQRSGSAPDPSGKHREYSHRFIVHGFWRNQWYPKLKTHRQKYIASYVKGPEGKPLLVKDRVWVWDR